MIQCILGRRSTGLLTLKPVSSSPMSTTVATTARMISVTPCSTLLAIVHWCWSRLPGSSSSRKLTSLSQTWRRNEVGQRFQYDVLALTFMVVLSCLGSSSLQVA
ncbi:unnamed protein product [Musa hybrid cultivar]